MADAAILISSSLLKPSSTPANRPNASPNPNPNPKLLLSNVRRDLTGPHRSSSPPPDSTRRLLKYYSRLASKLAGDGKLRDFLMIAESVLTSDAARVNTKMVAAGVREVLTEGRLDEVLEFLNGAVRLGICPLSLFDEVAVEALGAECRRFVEARRLEEFDELMETLAGKLVVLSITKCLSNFVGLVCVSGSQDSSFS